MKPVCVVKIGGALVDSGEAVLTLAVQMSELVKGYEIVVVHGGGPQATRMAAKYGHRPVIVEGRRVTSALDLELIEATVCGTVNSQLVAAFVGKGLRAVGMSGAAAGTVSVTKRPPWNVNGETIDFGLVGDIEHVDPTVIKLLVGAGYLPVVATIGIDREGELYNVNADTTASAVAAALGAERFCIVTDSRGLRKDDLLIDSCDEALFQSGKSEGWIADGMLVKLNAGFTALSQGVERVELVGFDVIVEGIGTRLVQSAETVGAP